MRAHRRNILALFSAFAALAACNAQPSAAGAAVGDMAMGDANAPVTLIEYASLSCGHCKDFHESVLPQLKDNYIDQGKVRYVFREFPAGNPELATAGALVARCIGTNSERYFTAVETFFHQQEAIFRAASEGRAREKLLEIARAGGISEERFDQCLSDPAAIAALTASAEAAQREFDVSGTPTLILDGEKLTQSATEPYSYERLSALIDAKLTK
jgi:protein-disulfide isomerase